MTAHKIKINLCLVSIKHFIVRTILCATIYNLLYITIICLFLILHTQLFAILLTTEIFKPRLTKFLLPIACLSCLSICPHNQFDKGSWSGMFGVSPSLNCCLHNTAHIACCCVRLLVYPFFSYACYCWFTCNKFGVFISVAFVYRLMLM